MTNLTITTVLILTAASMLLNIILIWFTNKQKQTIDMILNDVEEMIEELQRPKPKERPKPVSELSRYIPDDVEVNLSDGEVITFWKGPERVEKPKRGRGRPKKIATTAKTKRKTEKK